MTDKRSDSLQPNSKLEVPEELYKVDLELLSKYQSFSTELLRLSLIGISLFGFVLMNKKFFDVRKMTFFLVMSIICFGISSAFSLAHRFFSTKGFHYHIRFIRKKKDEYKILRNKIYRKSGIFLGLATLFLGIGASFICLGFFVYLKV